MKKLLLSVVTLSLVTTLSIMSSDGPLRYDSQGRPYVHKGRGPVFGSLAKIGTGSNRDYEEGARREAEEKKLKNNRGYRGERR